MSRKFYVRIDVNLAGFAYVNKIRSEVRMNGLRERKRLSAIQRFTFTHAVHGSLLSLFTDAWGQLILRLYERKI